MSDETVFGVALEKRFRDSADVAAIDISSNDAILIYDQSGAVIMRMSFSVLTAALSSALSGTYATLVDGKVPSSQLPSYVDDVLEFANYAALPATGETGKIYVLATPYTSGGITSSQFRWSGSAYAPIIASPGSTDAVTEGSVNLYHTTARFSGCPCSKCSRENGECHTFYQ